jgi:hypothetical protein
VLLRLVWLVVLVEVAQRRGHYLLLELQEVAQLEQCHLIYLPPIVYACLT